jgi:hypothetical protein
MTETFLHGVEVVEIDAGPRPIRTVRSAVIGVVGTAPIGIPNKTVLIAGSRREAVMQFGAPATGFSLPAALDAILDQSGAVIVAINVADRARHKVTRTEIESVPANNRIELGERNVFDVTVVSVGGAPVTFVAETDYVLDAAAGVMTRLPGGTIPAGGSVSVTWSTIDPALVTDSDVIGGVDAVTGAYTGLSALLGAEEKLGVSPRIIIAPNFSHRQAVATEMAAIANRLRAVAVVDGPNSTDADVQAYRQNFGDARVYLVDPWVKVLDPASGHELVEPASARVAGVIARIDAERGFWWSPSNQEIRGIVGTSRPIDFQLGDTSSRANLLNENEVATIIRQEGFRLWGNRTTASDPKFAFLSVRRTADIINDSLLRAHLWAVDRNITRTYVEDVTESVNAFLRHLTAIGAILGGRCFADPELNTPDQIAQGRVYFDFEFTPAFPAERVTFRSHLVNDFIAEIFA